MNTQPIQVLLVEDSTADAILLRERLTESRDVQFSVTHVQRLTPALAQLTRQPFDVVLLDLGLPDSQGLSTLQRLRRQTLDIPIVVMTGLADEALAVRSLQEGAQDYLVKGEAADGMTTRAIRYAIERKRNEDVARSHEMALAHLSRVSLMGQMAAGLAHELNQPLGAIVNYTSVCLEQLMAGNIDVEKMTTVIREVTNEARRAGGIISRLRSFVRKQEPRTSRLDVNLIVNESLNILRFEFRQQRIRPVLRLAEQLPAVLADQIQIEQVLVNLIYNALEAMKDGDPQNAELSVETSLVDAGDRVQVTVIDRGPGVAPEHMDRLFDPFFTTKSTGMGMGLNISRSIIESHGGRLSAAQNPGGGMRFCFTLPIAPAGR